MTRITRLWKVKSENDSNRHDKTQSKETNALEMGPQTSRKNTLLRESMLNIDSPKIKIGR